MIPQMDKWNIDIPPKQGLRLIYLEGDGARSFSELVILKTLMSELKAKKYPEESDEVMLPYEQFDMIGGRGTGGLFAIMFARLRMSIGEVMDEFSVIMKHVYDPQSLDRRRPQLKSCLEKMFSRRGLDQDIRLGDGWQEDDCAGFACAVSSGKRFRSYPSPRGSSNIRVIDAMLDTCASSSTIAPKNAPNPMLEFVSEARSLYRPESMVASLLSLGSGHFGITHIILPNNDTIMNLERICNSEVLAEKMQRRMRDIGVYFRFSIEHGMQKNESTYSDDLISVNAIALGYLDDEEVKEKASLYVETFNDGPGRINLDTLVQAISRQVTTRGRNENVAPSIEQYHVQREVFPEEGLIMTRNKDHEQIMINAQCNAILKADHIVIIKILWTPRGYNMVKGTEVRTLRDDSKCAEPRKKAQAHQYEIQIPEFV